MKALIFNIIILTISITCLGQENRDTNHVVLPQEGIWSSESNINSHTRCKNELADSLSKFTDSIWLDSLALNIDSTGIYTIKFTKKIDWRIDFKNLPVYIHECFELNKNEKFNLISISKEFNGRKQEIYSLIIGRDVWLVVRVRNITMLGNSQEGIDYEYYFKKN